MKVSKNGLIMRRTYDAPKVEIVEVEPQGVLCASADAAAYAGGGTESMTMTDIDWPN